MTHGDSAASQQSGNGNAKIGACPNCPRAVALYPGEVCANCGRTLPDPAPSGRYWLTDAQGKRLGIYRTHGEAVDARDRRPDAVGGSVFPADTEDRASRGARIAGLAEHAAASLADSHPDARNLRRWGREAQDIADGRLHGGEAGPDARLDRLETFVHDSLSQHGIA